jgi:hypothetical protein
MFKLLRQLWNGSSRVRQIQVRQHQFRPRLEILEDRFAPAVFNFNRITDLLNQPAGVVTLRSAIEVADAGPNGNSVNLTVDGNYQITLAGTPGQVDNAAGELAIEHRGNPQPGDD